jgi:hypothetical protein
MVVLIYLNYEHIVLNTKILLFLLSTNNFIVFLFVYSKDNRKVVELLVFMGAQKDTCKVWNCLYSWVLKKAPAILCGAESLCSCGYLKRYPQGSGVGRVCGYSKRYPQGSEIVCVHGYSKKHPRYCAVQSRCVVVGTQKDTCKEVKSLVFMGTQKDTHNIEHSIAN